MAAYLSGLQGLVDQLADKLEARQIEFDARALEIENESQVVVQAEANANALMQYVDPSGGLSVFVTEYGSALSALETTFGSLLGGIKATALDIDDYSTMDLSPALEELRAGIAKYGDLLADIDDAATLPKDFDDFLAIESKFAEFMQTLVAMNISLSANSGEVAVESIETAVDELTGSLDVLNVLFSQLSQELETVDPAEVAELRARFDGVLQNLTDLNGTVIGGNYTDQALWNPNSLTIETGDLGSTTAVHISSSLVDKFSGVVNFGDHVFDQNNTFRESRGHVPSPLLGYKSGRFTNGKVATEYLGQLLGVGSETFKYSGHSNNYAYMGATSAYDAANFGLYGNSAFTTSAGRGLRSQVDAFIANCGGSVDPRGLYVVSAGQVDLDREMITQFEAGTAAEDVNYDIVKAAIQGNVIAACDTLKAAGAKVVLVCGPGLLSDVSPMFSRDFVYDAEKPAIPMAYKQAQKEVVQWLDQQLDLAIQVAEQTRKQGDSSDVAMTVYLRTSTSAIISENVQLQRLQYTYDTTVKEDLDASGIAVPENQTCFWYDRLGSPSTQGHMALSAAMAHALEARTADIVDVLGDTFEYAVSVKEDPSGNAYEITNASLCPRFISSDSTAAANYKPHLVLFRGRNYKFLPRCGCPGFFTEHPMAFLNDSGEILKQAANNMIEWNIPKDFPGVIVSGEGDETVREDAAISYKCLNHENMGNSSTIRDAPIRALGYTPPADTGGGGGGGGGGEPVMPTEYDINLMIVAVGDRYELRMQNNVAVTGYQFDHTGMTAGSSDDKFGDFSVTVAASNVVGYSGSLTAIPVTAQGSYEVLFSYAGDATQSLTNLSFGDANGSPIANLMDEVKFPGETTGGGGGGGGGGGDPVMPTEYDINLLITAVGDRFELHMQNNVPVTGYQFDHAGMTAGTSDDKFGDFSVTVAASNVVGYSGSLTAIPVTAQGASVVLFSYAGDATQSLTNLSFGDANGSPIANLMDEVKFPGETTGGGGGGGGGDPVMPTEHDINLMITASGSGYDLMMQNNVAVTGYQFDHTGMTAGTADNKFGDFSVTVAASNVVGYSGSLTAIPITAQGASVVLFHFEGTAPITLTNLSFGDANGSPITGVMTEVVFP